MTNIKTECYRRTWKYRNIETGEMIPQIMMSVPLGAESSIYTDAGSVSGVMSGGTADKNLMWTVLKLR